MSYMLRGRSRFEGGIPAPLSKRTRFDRAKTGSLGKCSGDTEMQTIPVCRFLSISTQSDHSSQETGRLLPICFTAWLLLTMLDKILRKAKIGTHAFATVTHWNKHVVRERRQMLREIQPCWDYARCEVVSRSLSQSQQLCSSEKN